MSVVVVIRYLTFISYITNPFNVFLSTYLTFSIYFSFYLIATTLYPLNYVRFLYS